jgi:hypothetical protein
MNSDDKVYVLQYQNENGNWIDTDFFSRSMSISEYRLKILQRGNPMVHFRIAEYIREVDY